jgi:flavin reductase (DIM6/NTAB) family NADH-FMN oxidoreductase RutF
MSIDAPRYRQVIGHFPTGVTVITTNAGGKLHGMTANAIASVSLNPLLMLVSVAHDAHMHTEIEKAGRFGVNILSEAQEDVSRHFAQQLEPEQGRLGGFEYHLGAQGTPIIEGALAYVECEVADRHAGGDHTIFFGRVLGGDVLIEGRPLVYFRSGYGRIAT